MDNKRLNDKNIVENDSTDENMRTGFKWYQIAVPVLIGLIVVVWMFFKEFQNFDWETLPVWNLTMAFGLMLALIFVCGRDLGMMCRFRTITDGALTWKQAFKVCMLCEFSSAITPSAVGGSAVGMFFLNREGINMGRSTTLMMITILLDELFFVISIPFVVFTIPFGELFSSLDGVFTQGIRMAFWLIYFGIVVWTFILFAGIVWKPKIINRLLTGLFSIRILRRWKPKAGELAHNMVAASDEVRKKSHKWWLLAFGETAMSWLSRYLVVCALFIAFVPEADQLLVLARQFVVWAVLMVCPTPGGSGLSEWLFTQYYADMVSSVGLALVISLVWRVLTYYIYLAFGVVIIPSWLKGRHSEK